MSILTGKEIKRQIDLGNIFINPFFDEQLNPNSYDVRLGDRLLYYTLPNGYLNPRFDNPTQEIAIPSRGCMLHPGKVYLGSTMEFTSCGPFIPVLDGKSSLGRLGVFIHATAGYGDCYFAGNWTVEITVTHDTLVFPAMRIGQLRFHKPEGEIIPYSGKYQDSYGPIASRSYLGE